MLEKIAMWGGLAGVIIAIFAMVILYLTRSNIIDLLDRDVIMYDKNYELKKDALQSAFDCLDVVAQHGENAKNNPQFVKRAKEAYNALLCTVYSPRIYQEFYRYAIDKTSVFVSADELERFKIVCRGELMAHKRKGEGFKGSVDGERVLSAKPMQMPLNQPTQPANQPTQPAMPQPPQPPRPTQPRPAPNRMPPRPQPAQPPQPDTEADE